MNDPSDAKLRAVLLQSVVAEQAMDDLNAQHKPLDAKSEAALRKELLEIRYALSVERHKRIKAEKIADLARRVMEEWEPEYEARQVRYDGEVH